MVDLLINILTLTIALIFCRYIAYCIVYFFAKFLKFISKEKINITVYHITFDDIVCTTIMCLLLSSIFKIAGII